MEVPMRVENEESVFTAAVTCFDPDPDPDPYPYPASLVVTCCDPDPDPDPDPFS
jgi:hypothetical protein